MTATVSTKDAEVVATTPLEAVFVVDTECGNTVVSPSTGTVELRAGNSVKQIAGRFAGHSRPGATRLQVHPAEDFQRL